MATITIPEVIVPSELTSYGANDFLTVATVPMPNGDDSLLNTSSATSNQQKAWQTVHNGSFLMKPGGLCALSFWIRRRGAFSTFSNFSRLGTGQITGSVNGLILGVGDPIRSATLLTGPTAPLAWAFWANSADGVQFGINGGASQNRLFCSLPIGLTLNTWHLIVVNVNDSGPSATNRADVFRSGELITDSITSGANFIDPSFLLGNATIARFAIGDPTNSNSAARATTDTPIYDIAKVAFHESLLSPLDQLTMLESMRYGS